MRLPLTEEYKQPYEAARAYAKDPARNHYIWNAGQVYDFILFMADTGLRPDEAFNLQRRDITIAEHDADSLTRVDRYGAMALRFADEMRDIQTLDGIADTFVKSAREAGSNIWR